MWRILALVGVLVSWPLPSQAWGFEAHKFIADRMIELLPPELKPLFEERRPFIVERAIDPDLWRNVGWDEEPPNHFLDMDHEAFGPYPFNGLPRDYTDAVQKFGREFVHDAGAAAVAHVGVLRTPPARIRIAETQAGPRVRGRQHRPVCRDHRPLRVGRSRAAACRR